MIKNSNCSKSIVLIITVIMIMIQDERDNDKSDDNSNDNDNNRDDLNKENNYVNNYGNNNCKDENKSTASNCSSLFEVVVLHDKGRNDVDDCGRWLSYKAGFEV